MDTINIFKKIESNNEELNLIIDKDTNINLFNVSLKAINITILDNIKVVINAFNNNNKNLTKINFNIHSSSTLIYNLSNIVDDNYVLDIDIKYLGNNSKVITNIHSIVSNKEKILLKGIVENNYKNNELLENVKAIIEEKGECIVNPDILIDTKEVVANHKVAIAPLNKNELFYLMSKGLTETSSKFMLKRNFLLNNINNEELKNKIKEIL